VALVQSTRRTSAPAGGRGRAQRPPRFSRGWHRPCGTRGKRHQARTARAWI